MTLDTYERYRDVFLLLLAGMVSSDWTRGHNSLSSAGVSHYQVVITLVTLRLFSSQTKPNWNDLLKR